SMTTNSHWRPSISHCPESSRRMRCGCENVAAVFQCQSCASASAGSDGTSLMAALKKPSVVDSVRKTALWSEALRKRRNGYRPLTCCPPHRLHASAIVTRRLRQHRPIPPGQRYHCQGTAAAAALCAAQTERRIEACGIPACGSIPPYSILPVQS